MTDPDRLASIRRVDWRFLLPETAFGTVVVVGDADVALVSGLDQVARQVIVTRRDGASDDEPAADLVVSIAPGRTTLEGALRRVAAGGWIYVGAGPARAPGRASLGQVAAALRSAGFVDVRRSWHWPSEPSALEIVPLDHPGAVRLVLGRRRSGPMARAKATLAGIAHRLGLLERIVPGWSVIGRRPAGDAAQTAAPSLDPVRANVAGGTDPNVGVVLLTPRFMASRHVIGLVLRPSDDVPLAVAKLPRLPQDDGGIRREAAALRRAAELGATGIPEVFAHSGIPKPLLVESALDGVVIASREVRARSVGMIDEVEAWTRTLAGPQPSPHPVPFRTLWAPAVQRISHDLGPVAADDPMSIVPLAERTARTLGALDSVSVPAVLEHGDLAPPNLLRLRDGRLGVVDWEVADPDGLPLGDLLFFAAFAGPEDAARAAVERQASHLGIHAALIPALRLAMWARWADRQLARFIDRSIPLEKRLQARHVESWATALAHLEVQD